MDPELSCPTGYVLDGKYCYFLPTVSCANGYTLSNGVCYATTGSGTPSMAPPTVTLDGNCPTGYTFNSGDNLCYPI